MLRNLSRRGDCAIALFPNPVQSTAETHTKYIHIYKIDESIMGDVADTGVQERLLRGWTVGSKP